MMYRTWTALTLAGLLVILSACGRSGAVPTATTPPLASELVVAGWSEDQIVRLLPEFEREYGVKVTYHVYNSQEETIEEIRAGEAYDIVTIENHFIPEMIAGGLLSEIDHRYVPNFKNISANFRNLTHDPDNRYTIPYSWGTTGLLVRTDLVSAPVTRWADLWDPRYAGRVFGWLSSPRYMIGAALLSLGYSPNSESPAELEAALARLIELKPHAIWEGGDTTSSAPWLVSGEAVMALGWAYDVTLAQEGSPNVSYVLPEEGAMLWGDNLVIPSTTHSQYTAELFLNFVLRPEITGQLISLNYYPMPNDAATPFVDPTVLNDPVIYPSNEQMKNAVLLLPLSADGDKLYRDIWARFMATGY